MPTPGGPYRVALVCLGNICRSPMAHVVLERQLAEAGLAEQVTVGSGGIGGWHRGDPMDERSAAVLAAAGYDPTRHRARHFTIDWYAEYDLLLAMDHRNRADMLELAPTVESQLQVQLFRAFDPLAAPGDDEVPDPYYGGPEGFVDLLTMVERTCRPLVEHLTQVVQIR